MLTPLHSSTRSSQRSSYQTLSVQDCQCVGIVPSYMHVHTHAIPKKDIQNDKNMAGVIITWLRKIAAWIKEVRVSVSLGNIIYIENTMLEWVALEVQTILDSWWNGDIFFLNTCSPFAHFLVEQSRALSWGGCVLFGCTYMFELRALTLLFLGLAFAPFGRRSGHTVEIATACSHAEFHLKPRGAWNFFLPLPVTPQKYHI